MRPAILTRYFCFSQPRHFTLHFYQSRTSLLTNNRSGYLLWLAGSFHISSFDLHRDSRTYEKDKYDWSDIEKEVFKEFEFGEKKPKFQTVRNYEMNVPFSSHQHQEK
jgi:hypothetical protein